LRRGALIYNGQETRGYSQGKGGMYLYEGKQTNTKLPF